MPAEYPPVELLEPLPEPLPEPEPLVGVKKLGVESTGGVLVTVINVEPP